MAIELKRTTQFNVSVVVNNAVSAVRAVRAQESSRKEAEFQKAVASGLTYADQVKYREEQLKKESEGGFQDVEYIAELEKAIAQTKQLSRFEKIRTKYKDALDDYVTGKESINSYLELLNETLDGEKDETMRTEIRNLISQATQEKATNELNAIKNRALVAQKDNSVNTINNSISEIKSRRARASIAENEDEVAMWDETLIALEGSKAKLQIEDSMNEITFKINKYNPKANDKLGYLNDEIAKADSRNEITYNGVTYESMKAFWENKRGEYISSGYFDEVKKDMDAETARIASTSSFGQIPTARIAAVNDYFNSLKSRPEFAPFADQIEQKRVENLSAMTNDLAESIFNEEATTGDRAKAENAILGLEQKFGISVSREPFARELSKGSSIAAEALKTPSAPGVGGAATTGGSYVVAAGDNLGRIAAKNGVSLLQLLDANPEYKANPNMVRQGATIKLPGGAPVATAPAPTTPTTPSPTTPTAPVTPQNKPTVTAPTTPQNQPTKPIAPTPVNTPAPVKPVTPAPTPAVAPVATTTPKYTGTSVVDLLKSKGQDSSFAARQKLAQEKGIANYTGAAQQNDQLLKLLNT